MAGRDHQRGVAVLRTFRDDVARDGAAGAGLVLDDDALAEHLGQRIGDHARRNIGAAAGAEADHDADRPRRPLLRSSGESREAGERHRRHRKRFHKFLPQDVLLARLRARYADSRRGSARRVKPVRTC